MKNINKNIKPSELLRLVTTNGSSSYLCNRIKYYGNFPHCVDSNTIDLVVARITDYCNQNKSCYSSTYGHYLYERTGIVYYPFQNPYQDAFIGFLRDKLALFLAEEFEAKGL